MLSMQSHRDGRSCSAVLKAASFACFLRRPIPNEGSPSLANSEGDSRHAADERMWRRRQREAWAPSAYGWAFHLQIRSSAS